MILERYEDTLVIRAAKDSDWFLVIEALKEYNIDINDRQNCGIERVIFDLKDGKVGSVVIAVLISFMILKYRNVICYPSPSIVKRIFSLLDIYNSFIYYQSLEEALVEEKINTNGGPTWVKKAESLVRVARANQQSQEQAAQVSHQKQSNI